MLLKMSDSPEDRLKEGNYIKIVGKICVKYGISNLSFASMNPSRYSSFCFSFPTVDAALRKGLAREINKPENYKLSRKLMSK